MDFPDTTKWPKPLSAEDYSKQADHMGYLKDKQFEAHLRSKYKITVEELKQLVKHNYLERFV